MIDFKSNSVIKLSPVEVGEIYDLVKDLIIDGEDVLYAFKAMRDVVFVTNKRIITINTQGVTGKKKDYTSLPFSKVTAYSIETSGLIDMDSELVLWFSGLGEVKLQIKNNFNMMELNNVISSYIL